MGNERIKIVWLCHFANQEMINYFHTPSVSEFSPWIDNLISLFRNKSKIELHIVSPNVFTNKNEDFILNNINYHFYKFKPQIIPKKIYRIAKIDLITNYFYPRRKVIAIIKKVNPDLINLHGAENPQYSAAILDLIKFFPTLISIQGFVRNASSSDTVTKKRIQIEENIIKGAEHFGICTLEMIDIIKKINKNPQFYYHDYPYTVPLIEKNNHGEFEPIDCLFFAKVVKDKGIEDLLQAISIIKGKKKDVTLCVIGKATPYYLEHLLNMCNQLEINNNVKFIGFLSTQHEVYQYVLKSKICVLPTYHDAIPGTIIESMFLKLPVIAYAVGGIPELNEDGENIILIEKNNINALAQGIYNLLNNINKRKELTENAYKFVTKKFDNSRIPDTLINHYYQIIEKSKGTKQI